MKNLATQADVTNFLNQQNQLLIVKFGAEWCQPCAEIDPDFEALASELTARNEPVAFAKIDQDDDNADVFETHGIVKLPTFVVAEGPDVFTVERPSVERLRSVVRSSMPMPDLSLADDF